MGSWRYDKNGKAQLMDADEGMIAEVCFDFTLGRCGGAAYQFVPQEMVQPLECAIVWGRKEGGKKEK